jgi:hypothetical protein
MALYGDAAMVLYYDIEGDNADHDDWHTYEHMHERLSIPGFLRATRWVAKSGTPRYLVIYEQEEVGVGTSEAYLERLNHPTPWTASMMPRFRNMMRGFCAVTASAGYGLGNAAVSVRFVPDEGKGPGVREQLARHVFPAVASWRGMASVHLFEPALQPPMTREQAIRGKDKDMTWVVLATGYDADALAKAVDRHLEPRVLGQHGVSAPLEKGSYALHYTVTDREVARTAANPLLDPEARQRAGPRR